MDNKKQYKSPVRKVRDSKTSLNLNAQILSWSEVREEVRQVNHVFADIVDNLEFQGEITFCKVRYPYGAVVFDDGKLYVPNEQNKFVPINDASVSKQYKEFFDYGPAPLGIVLKRCYVPSYFR